jgi:hypothetical protein
MLASIHGVRIHVVCSPVDPCSSTCQSGKATLAHSCRSTGRGPQSRHRSDHWPSRSSCQWPSQPQHGEHTGLHSLGWQDVEHRLGRGVLPQSSHQSNCWQSCSSRHGPVDHSTACGRSALAGACGGVGVGVFWGGGGRGDRRGVAVVAKTKQLSSCCRGCSSCQCAKSTTAH